MNGDFATRRARFSPNAARAMPPMSASRTGGAHGASRQAAPNRGTVAALGLGLSGAMAATILLSLLAGKVVIYLALVGFVLTIVTYLFTDLCSAMIAFLAYVAMEGMFKYASNFSQVVYVIKPALMLAIWVAWCAGRHNKNIARRDPPLKMLLLGLTIWGAMQIFHPEGGGYAQSVATLLLWYLEPIAILWLVFNVFSTARQVERFVWALILISTVVSSFAILQFSMGREWTYAHVPGYINLKSLEWTTFDARGAIVAYAFRPASTAAQGGAGSGWGHVGIILSLALLALPRPGAERKIGLMACLLVNILGVLVGGARVFVVLSLIEVVVFLILTARSQRSLARNLGVMFLAGVVCLGSFTLAQSISGGTLFKRYAETLTDPATRFKQERGGSAGYFIQFLTQHPLGIGFQRGFGGGEDRFASKEAATINRETQLNATAADMGFPGVILVASLLIGFLTQGWRALKRVRDPSLRVIAAMILAFLVGVNFAAWGAPVLLGNEIVWFLAALMFALPAIDKRERERAAQFAATPARVATQVQNMAAPQPI